MIYIDEAVSTNDLAKKYGLDGAADKTVIWTDNQTGGRGRFGRNWYSKKGDGLAVSFILRQREHIFSPGEITLTAAVAVCNLLKKKDFPAGIKWPNDIIISGKKVCGILAEQSFFGNRAEFLVLGIGLNVNNSFFTEEISEKATSLCIESGRGWDVHGIAEELANLFLKEYEALENEKERIFKEYSKNCLNIGHDVLALSDKGEIRGVAVGIDSDGSLLIKTESSIVRVQSGEVSLRNPNGSNYI